MKPNVLAIRHDAYLFEAIEGAGIGGAQSSDDLLDKNRSDIIETWQSGRGRNVG